jgi:hypothetical protein
MYIISDILFKTVAIGKYHIDALMGELKLTRKQYYMRMSRLMKADLIKRKNGMYILTSLGKIVFHYENLIEIALKDYWKLKLIDIVKTDDKIEAEACAKLVDTLIDNKEIKEIIFADKQQAAAHPTRSGDIELVHSMSR